MGFVDCQVNACGVSSAFEVEIAPLGDDGSTALDVGGLTLL